MRRPVIGWLTKKGEVREVRARRPPSGVLAEDDLRRTLDADPSAEVKPPIRITELFASASLTGLPKSFLP